MEEGESGNCSLQAVTVSLNTSMLFKKNSCAQKTAAFRKENMNLAIRPEQPGDYRETEDMTREAFWNHYSPGCYEHYLLHIMRECPAFVPELDLVAVHDGKIVGNAVCLKTVIQGDNGKNYDVLSLGPISVLPGHQRRGIGGKLIEHTKRAAREMGFRALLLYGDPAYYTRHGFIAAEQLGIRTADDMYAAAHQVCELSTNALEGATGRYIEDGIYDIDEAAAAVFDANFPAKEKIVGTPSQQRFEEMVVMRKSAF